MVVIISLGPRYLLSDRSPSGEPGRAWNQSGWGIPRWGPQRVGMGLSGPMKPMPIGARYFCGDCNSVKENKPIALGHKFGVSKEEYQKAVTAHYSDNHPDLHYPLPQDLLDIMEKRKTKAASVKRTHRKLDALNKLIAKHPEDFPVLGGIDVSGGYQRVARPRELPDFTEFDFPDANLADAAAEEIEFDQLISIQARQGRRFLGAEFQNFDIEMLLEMLTVPDNDDLSASFILGINTRTGAHNLDDPQQLWRMQHGQVVSNVEATAGTGTAVATDFGGLADVPPGGRVYVAPRAFQRFANDLDRQVDTGDLFGLWATINQRLGSFLLFELLEQYSGLFGLT